MSTTTTTYSYRGIGGARITVVSGPGGSVKVTHLPVARLFVVERLGAGGLPSATISVEGSEGDAFWVADEAVRHAG